MHILHTVLHTFHTVLTRRILLTIKSFLCWKSFPLFLWLVCLIQGWYCERKLDSGHSKRSKGSWGHCRILLKVCVFSNFSITWLTYNVVIVFICWSCTEVYPVSLANLLDLFRWSRETKETWMKLYNRRNMYLIREKAVGILNGIKKKTFLRNCH